MFKINDQQRREYQIYIKKLHRKIKWEKSKNERLRRHFRKFFSKGIHAIRSYKHLQNKRNSLEIEYENLRNSKKIEYIKLNEELEAMSKEYFQIMSERDNVNKEMEALEEKLNKIEENYSKKLKQTKCNNYRRLRF